MANDDNHKLYLGNLSHEVTERIIRDAFKKFGSIKTVWFVLQMPIALVLDAMHCRVARKPPGFAFLTFDEPLDAHDRLLEVASQLAKAPAMSHRSNPLRSPPR